RQGTHSEVEEHSESTRDRRRYQTRVVATANQVNLTFDEARGHLTEALAKSIAGIF
ncbi:MAG: complement resistance protein TraT, partial [Gammaproteobacteria bacterium]